MRVAVFAAKRYDSQFLKEANKGAEHQIDFLETSLNESTAPLARNYDCACVFVNDRIDRATLEILARGATRLIALRCAGYNNVDLAVANDLGIGVVRVPSYSPHAVAEHVLALLLTLYRSTHRAHNRVREGNFSLEGMVGHEIHGRSVGIVGTGQIGSIVAKLFHGFGCRLLAHDVRENPEVTALGASYVPLSELWQESQIVTLHCPLLESTRHVVSFESLGLMQDGVTLLNTSRGGLVDTQAVYQALKSGKVGYLGIDVYEEEENLFFEDLSSAIIMDDLFMRLTTFPNVLITGHQAFFTHRALTNIAQTTIANITEYEQSGRCDNEVSLPSA